MRRNYLGEMRRGLLLTQGPGSILEFRVDDAAVSVIFPGLELWEQYAPTRDKKVEDRTVIFDDRLKEILENKLKERFKTDQAFINFFRLPPVVEDIEKATNGVLPAIRFPQWLFCTECKNLKKQEEWDFEAGSPALFCPSCSANKPSEEKSFVISSRFVLSCANGHLDDFPWREWLNHFGGNPNCAHDRLSLVTEKSGEMGTGGEIVKCNECGAKASLGRIFESDALKEAGIKCSGHRPWLGDYEECEETPRIILKNAANCYFPVIESALTIPPWQDNSEKKWGTPFVSLYKNFKSESEEDLFQQAEKYFKNKIQFEGYDDDLEEMMRDFKKSVAYFDNPRKEPLEEEYMALTDNWQGEEGFKETPDFKREEMASPVLFSGYLEKIVKVSKLREVKALLAFKRIEPPADSINPGKGRFALLSKSPKDWFPAQEVFGEGIFFSLNEDKLSAWEKGEEISVLAKSLHKAWKDDWNKSIQYNNSTKQTEPVPHITPRFLLLHSLAHALINQLALDSGYNASSLKERIYSSDSMAGILIYTSSSDAEGTLGSLSEKAETSFFESTLKGALISNAMCSNDPICVDGVLSLTESYNPAACHTCLILPETSCIYFNRFLDRKTISGSHYSEKPDTNVKSFFEPKLKEFLFES